MTQEQLEHQVEELKRELGLLRSLVIDHLSNQALHPNPKRDTLASDKVEYLHVG